MGRCSSRRQPRRCAMPTITRRSAGSPSGFLIIEQGEPANALFLLLSGHADVVREDTQGRRDLVARLQPGQFFGEQGIAQRKPRNARHCRGQYHMPGTHAPTAHPL